MFMTDLRGHAYDQAAVLADRTTAPLTTVPGGMRSSGWTPMILASAA
jgi:hypothetical protein